MAARDRRRGSLLVRSPALLLGALLLAGSAAAADEAAQPETKASTDDEFNAALRNGDEAYLDKNFTTAAAEYEKVVDRQPHNPIGYARLAAAQRELGQLGEAFATLASGLEANTTITERAKLIFLQADIRERQRAHDKATARWTAYLNVAGGGERTIDLDAPDSTPKPAEAGPKGEKVYPATADERIKQLEAAKQREKDYGPVRQRIKKREQEADAKSRKR